MNAPAPAAIGARQKFLGGSDIGAILGVSPWKTPVDIYLEKTGQAIAAAPDPDKEKLFRRGKRLEPVVLEMLLEERGIETLVRNERYVDAVYPFMACEVDGEAIVEGEHVNLEAKTSHPFARKFWGEEGTDEIDISYTAQALWGMGITGRKRCIFAVLVGSDTLLTFEVKRDDELIAQMRARAVAFWNDHVLAGVPPQPLNVFDTYKLFRKAPSSKVEATPEVIALCQDLERAKDDQRIAAERELECKYEIGKYMLGASGIMLGSKGKLLPAPDLKPGQHMLHVGGKPLLTLALIQQSRLDTARLAKERPEIAAEFQKSTTVFRFDRPRSKK